MTGRLWISIIVSVFAPIPTPEKLPEQKEKTPVQQKDCKPDVKGWMETGEEVVGSICKTKYDFVLTNTSLYTVRKHGKVTYGNITLTSSSSIRDLREILSAGLVCWTASEDTAYILTSDRVLTLIPEDLRGDKLPAYRVPFCVDNAKMTFHSGKLFIAGESQLVVVTFSEKVKSRVDLFYLETKDRDFFESEGTLFYGNQDENIEL